MSEWGGLGKILIILAIALAVFGALLIGSQKFPGWLSVFGWLGRLPGDISIKRDNFSLYFPLATSLIISVILSILVYLWSFFSNR